MARIQRGNPNQLKMFMTPREITSQYQVLDGDRQDYDSESARAYSITQRSRMTGGQTNERWMGTTGSPSYRRPSNPETDEQVMSRKLQESQMEPDDYSEHIHGEISASGKSFDFANVMDRESYPEYPDTSDSSRIDSYHQREGEYLDRKAGEHYAARDSRRSLYSSVKEGGVQSPITLATASPGSLNKQQILGGHHRLAAALDARPDDYVPVVHAADIHVAKSDKHQKYT